MDPALVHHLMANEYATEALLSGSGDHSHQLSENAALKRRKSRSIALVGINQFEQNSVELPTRSQSIFAEKLNFKHVCMFLAAYLGVGALCFSVIGEQIKGSKTNGIVDAIYFCVVTMTTVGYGDLIPDSTLAKLLACIFAFSGMAVVGFILSKAADYIVEKQEILLVKAIHMREKYGPTEILKDVETNKVRYKLFTTMALLLVLVVIGTLLLFEIEGLDLFDAFYCVCATITTLGYGDKSFSTKGGRIFAIFWIIMSTVCLAQFFLYLAELYAEHKQKAMIKWVLARKMTTRDLEAADLDKDKIVSAAEFIVSKLKEMEKITDEDISILMEKFKSLDADHSGTLTAADLVTSQSSQAQG